MRSRSMARHGSGTWTRTLLALAASVQCLQPACGPERPASDVSSARSTLTTPATATTPSATTSGAPPATFMPPGADGYGRAGTLRYLEHVVGAEPHASLPMIIVIHGLGDRPGPHWLDLVQLEHPARLIMPEAPTPYFDGYSWFPFRARGADPAELARGIAAAAEQLASALEALQRHRPTRGRPIVTGFSQGGMLSFALALRHPERLELALPISGLLPEPLWPAGPAKTRTPPILALHGTADELVPFPPTERLVAQLRAHGYDATLVPYAGVGHSISDAMRARVSSTLNDALARVPR